ncbi:kelch-like protein 18 [Rhinatrema bivittatum]|uniref:kelch-like protein 18 n=1 Tax=Rhinatrema bivittatum TaxID=194408 RepID=UPI00112A840A|nr:kelch-like protein 18 [Rhinatrema bivittatum]
MVGFPPFSHGEWGQQTSVFPANRPCKVQIFQTLFAAVSSLLQTLVKFVISVLAQAGLALRKRVLFCNDGVSVQRNRELDSWQRNTQQRIYHSRETESRSSVTVQTSICSFQVDLERLMEHSEYFRALSTSCMKETLENQILLDHIPSNAFHSILEYVFKNKFYMEQELLLPSIEAANYLACQSYLEKCWVSLRSFLSPETCLMYLDFAKSIVCEEMQAVVHQYLSDGLLELRSITKALEEGERDRLVRLRMQGPQDLCVLKKENLISGSQRELDPMRFLYRLALEKKGFWSRGTKLPFIAEKWNFSTAVLWNYLFVIGGYKQKVRRGSEFRMAAFRYNPILDCWDTTAPLLKRRRHFSMAATHCHIFAIGGWYLDCLLAPDSSTCLYTAVERYDPWTDTWTFVSSLPLTDFSFTVSLSHDLPLCAVHSSCIYVLGSVQKTEEKLVLQYNIQTDTWQELLPTLTRADANIPGLYFLGGSDPLYLVGGNNQENVTVSFSPGSRHWGAARRMPKCSLAGQGASLQNHFFMPAPELNSVLEIDLVSLHTQTLQPLPYPLSYEALFFLYFPPEERKREKVEVD